MSHTLGRPQEHDRLKIAQELIEWAKLDDSINLNGFCAMKMLVPRYISQWAKENEDFRLAYELAKAILANRREKKLSKNELHVKAYDLNARVYDAFLDDKHKEIANDTKDNQSDVLEGLSNLAKELKSKS